MLVPTLVMASIMTTHMDSITQEAEQHTAPGMASGVEWGPEDCWDTCLGVRGKWCNSNRNVKAGNKEGIYNLNLFVLSRNQPYNHGYNGFGNTRPSPNRDASSSSGTRTASGWRKDMNIPELHIFMEH